MEIVLANLGADPIPLSASNLSISRISDAGAPEFTNANTSRSAASWITFDQTDLILAANSDQKVWATINVPKDTAPGGYSAAVIFQAKLPSFYFDLDANARILPALSTSFLITVAPISGELPSAKDVKISSFQVPSVVVSGPVPVVTEITNPTNFFIYADGDLTIKPTFGENKTLTELARSVILPETSRTYVTTYSDRIWPGVYTATMSIGNGENILVASAKFVAVPWQFILIVFVLLTIIVGMSGRRRLKKALFALQGKDSFPHP